LDEDLLNQIWEEIRLEGFQLFQFLFCYSDWVNVLFSKSEIENAETNLVESLADYSTGQQIICPVCLKLPAQLDESHNLTCSCGLKFPLPNHIDLKDFEATLLTGNDIHSETCSSTPTYEVRPTKESSLQFTSSCESCLYFNIVLETPI
jgi:hypothetical protein